VKRITIPDILRRYWKAAAFFALALLNLLLVMHRFPASSLRERNPLVSLELGWHFADAAEGHAFLRGRGAIWGYSPHFMAGYPFGAWNSVGRRGYESASCLFFFADFETAYYIWLVLASCLPPVLIALAFALLGRIGGETVACFTIATIVHQFGNIVAYVWRSGMIAFPFACAWAVLYVALLVRTLERRSWICAVAGGLALAAQVWLHPLVLPAAGIGTVAALLVYRRETLRPAMLLRLAVLAAIALALVLPWAGVLCALRDTRIHMFHERMLSGVKHFVMDFFSDRRYRFHFDRRVLLHAVMVLAFLGVWRTHGNERRAPLVMGLTVLGLLACTYGFAYNGFLKQTTPYRYLTGAKLFALLPATVGLARAADLWRGANRNGRILAVCLAIALMPGFAGYAFDYAYVGRVRHVGMDRNEKAVIVWLKKNAPRNGRVVCDRNIGNLIPYQTGLEVIGGTLSDEATLAHTWTSTGLAGAFGRRGPAADVARRRVRTAQYLDLYNVGAVVTADPLLREDMSAQEHWHRAPDIGPFAVFMTAPERLSFVVEGAAQKGVVVNAESDRIVIENAPAGSFTIKYHYLASLSASGGARLHAASVPDDPVPFIGVDNAAGRERIEIRNGR